MTTVDVDVVPAGRALLVSIRDGELPPPPAADLLGLELVDVGDGQAGFVLRPSGRYDNSQGAVHGGILAAVADFAVTSAVLTTADAGERVLTTNLAVTYVRPVGLTGGPLRCTGRVVHRGRRLAHAEAAFTDDDGRLCATATATCVIDDPTRGVAGT